jgi:MFS family permease
VVITISLTVFALPMLLIAKQAGRLSDRFGPRWTSVISAAASVPLMAMYGFVGLVPVVMAMAIPHGICEAIQSPGTQAAVADAAPRADAAAAQGLAEAAGRQQRRSVHSPRRRCSRCSGQDLHGSSPPS